MKIYLASPFFNKFQSLVKANMIRNAKVHFGDDQGYFDPASTEASRSYDTSPNYDLAMTILNENIQHIKSSDILIYPSETNDLGTLMEVGMALRLGLSIYKYDYISESIELQNFTNPEKLMITTKSFIRLGHPYDAIVLGYNYDKGKSLYYDIGDNSDNIMLSIFNRVEFNGSNYVLVNRDYTEVK